jgi:KUP system potassium uptake protein
VFRALNPLLGLEFIFTHGVIGLAVMGLVFLAVTGAEALYADMGHFGARPIRLAWLSIVLPALLVNYYGQGALLLDDSSAANNPFFRLAPEWAIYPLVALATAATVIASQATISGAFSMAQQAALLGLSPRLRIEHTSASAFGQIYVPAINWLQLAGVVLLVLAFKTSSNLAAAYGTAVTATMLVTTLLVFALARREWRWRWPLVVTVLGSLAVVDFGLVTANMLKFVQGGWVPVLVAVAVFTIMWTWYQARSALAARELEGALPIEEFLRGINPGRLHRPQFTAVYLTAQPGNTPNCLLHNLKHNHVLHEHTVLLKIMIADEPYVLPETRASLLHLGKGIHRLVLRYGFMEQPDVPRDLADLADRGVPFDPMRTSYFVGRSSFVASSRPLLPRWQEHIFLAIARVATSAADFFGLPANRVVELGSRNEI